MIRKISPECFEIMRISQQSELQKCMANSEILIYCFKETFLSKTLLDFKFSSHNVPLGFHKPFVTILASK